MSTASAQKAIVVTESREIEGLKREGMSMLVEFEKKTVEKSWVKLLKTYGKPDTWRSGAVVLLQPANTGNILTGYDWVSRIDATKLGTKVFLSLGSKGEYAKPADPDFDKGRQFMQAFARQLYIDDIQEQIAAAEKATEEASQTHDKTAQVGEQLKKQLERNANDQTQLQKNLDNKRAEAERIKNEVKQNKLDQEAALEEIKRVRKAAEDKRLKLQQAG